MILNLTFNALILIQMISLAAVITTFGSLFLFFGRTLSRHISPAPHFALPISIAVLCQAVIGTLIYKDVKKRLWNDEVKAAIWTSLGRTDHVPYNFSLLAVPVLSISYYLINMKGDPTRNWWREKHRTSALFRLVAHRAVMASLSTSLAVSPFAFMAGVLLFLLGGILDVVRLSLLGFHVLGGMIIILPPVFALFQFMVLTHFLSRQWTDHSYELFYGRFPACHWPKHDWIDAQRYYREIMAGETRAAHAKP